MSERPDTLLPEPRLSGGTVLAGKYKVTKPLSAHGQTELYAAEDLTLDRRPLIAVRVRSLDPQVAAATWSALDGPSFAPLIEVLELGEGVAGLFAIGRSAIPLTRTTGLSREQRAALLCSIARCMEISPQVPTGVRFVAPDLLWVEGAPQEPAARVVPMLLGADTAEQARAADLHAWAKLVGAQLYGIDESSWTERSLASIPQTLRVILTPLLDPDPSVRLSAGLSAALFERTLGIDEATRRVPVPVAPPPSPEALTRVSHARNVAMQRARRELVIALIALGIGGVLGGFVIAQRNAILADLEETAEGLPDKAAGEATNGHAEEPAEVPPDKPAGEAPNGPADGPAGEPPVERIEKERL